MKTCILPSCPKKIDSRGLCSSHYAKHRKLGDIDTVGLPRQYKHYLADVNPDDRTAVCTQCGLTKIHAYGTDKYGHQKYVCVSKAIDYRRRNSVYTFGDGDTIPIAEASAARLRLYKEQDGRCAICTRSEAEVGTLCLDHCHATGEIRGLLCTGCNKGLGFFKDSPETLTAASEYLTR